MLCFFFSSRRRHTRCGRDWSSDVCSSDLLSGVRLPPPGGSPATPVVPAVRTVVVGGMPGWQIALIAIAAALIAALAAALVTALVAMPGERARRPASSGAPGGS